MLILKGRTAFVEEVWIWKIFCKLKIWNKIWVIILIKMENDCRRPNHTAQWTIKSVNHIHTLDSLSMQSKKTSLVVSLNKFNNQIIFWLKGSSEKHSYYQIIIIIFFYVKSFLSFGLITWFRKTLPPNL